MPAHASLLDHAGAFREALLSWYRVHQRPLPWREAPSLYKTVVSEFMLQQTQVKTALPYFHAWLNRFPDFEALAAASEDDVLKAWEGLGYYSRARNLHRLSRAVTASGEPPRTREEWLELPGIGPYTAAAISSIALGRPHACVDGNVVRILTRLLADDTEYRDSGTAAKALTAVAEALLSPTHPGDHNQAMMELGATICHRQKPLCTVCPVLTHCQAGRSGDPERFPRLAPKRFEKIEVDRIWCLENGALLLHRAGETARRFAGMHELPSRADLGMETMPPGAVLRTRQKRTITRFQIVESIFQIPRDLLPYTQTSENGLTWVSLDDLDSVTLSGPHRRWIKSLLAEPAP